MLKYLIPAIVLIACSFTFALQARGRQHIITIDAGQYSPARITINTGETIVWKNIDERDHTVKADDDSFNSGTIRPNETFQHRFTRAGIYDYACAFHPRMKGTVVVQRRQNQ